MTLILFVASIVWISILSLAQSISISSSCNNKSMNGVYYIKPTDDGGIIPVICNNGYTMLDLSLNFEVTSTYFSSIYQYGDDGRLMYGTDCSDSSGWRNWFLPANDNTKFRVARHCLECKSGSKYDDNTAYYMTTGYFCPIMIDDIGCVEYDESNPWCNVCDDNEGLCGEGGGRDGDINGKWCDCYTMQLSSDQETVHRHERYCQKDLVWRPNVVVDRSQCTCYKPLDEELKIYNDISLDDLPSVATDYRAQMEQLYVDDLIIWNDDDDTTLTKKECADIWTYLSNDDFKYGTYRITDCGNYILTENIVINFNKPTKPFIYSNGDSPNAYDLNDLYWFPTTEQQNSGQYFGLDAFWGPFTLGFFAAISIETSHVYIDLNGFSIRMDYEFYLQQRFFAIIELGNKPFEAKQGPVDFGRNDFMNEDIMIKNGVLGLSSHHGIHGSNVRHVTLEDLQIMKFDSCGIQCNGCTKMMIQNTKIGPQNIDIPVRGRYTHARSVLSRLRFLVEEHGDASLQFANRDKAVTVKELADHFVEQMDMVYYHVMQGIEFDDDDPTWIAAKNTFINPTGWMDGGSSYGILLNGLGTAVVNIGRRRANTWDITVKNVEIFGIRLQAHEGFWAQSEGRIIHGFFFETIDWLGGIYDAKTGYYIGDAYTDILFATNTLLQSDFCPLGSLFYLNGLMDWVFVDETSVYSKNIALDFQCGSDIQSHSAKGAIGIRIDGTKRFHLEDVHIHDLVNWGDLGSNACGEYEKVTFEVGVDVDKDIQYGYTGHKVHAILTDYATGDIKNVKISNLESWHSSATAIAIYKGSTVYFDGLIEINNIIAGSKLTQSEVNELILPNPVPYLCTIQIGPNSGNDESLTPIINIGDDFIVSSNNLYSYDYCDETTRLGDMKPPNVPQLLYKKEEAINYYVLPFTINYFHSLYIIIFAVLIVIVLFVRFSKEKQVKKNQNDAKYGSINKS